MILSGQSVDFRLKRRLGGTLSHNCHSYESIGTHRVTLDVIKYDYKPTFVKRSPRQRNVACNHAISAKASFDLDKEVRVFLTKELHMRWAWYQGSMSVHILQYLNLSVLLINRYLS